MRNIKKEQKERPSGRVLTEEEIKAQEPKRLEKAKNFTKAMFRVLNVKIRGGDIYVSEEELQQRLDICSRCQFLKEKGKGQYYCASSGCGCQIKKAHKSFLSKTSLKSEKCPRGFWEAEKRKQNEGINSTNS